MPRKRLTPEQRSEKIEKVNKTARRTYRKTTKRRKITPDELVLIQDIVVPLKTVGYSNLQIGLVAGISKGQISEITKDPKIQARIAKLKVGLPQAALDLMRAYMIEAVMAIVHVMRTSESDGDVLKAAAEIFDRGGMPKMTRSEQSNKFDADPEADSLAEKSLMDELRTADPEIQEKAAELKDFFEDGLRSLLKEGKVPDENSGQTPPGK